MKASRRFLKFLWEQFVEDSCLQTAQALTYQTLFAIVPLLTLTYTVLSLFEAYSGVGQIVEEFLFSNIVPENIAVVQDYLHSFSNQARQLSLPSLILLAVVALMMLMTIEKTLNKIWRIREPRHGFQRLLMYWAVLTLGPLLVGCALAISTYVFSMPFVSNVTEATGILNYLPLLLGAAFFTLIYVAVPNCNVPFVNALMGGCFAALFFELAKLMFALLVTNTDFAVIYGAFAAVPLLLMWIYLCWVIALLGAEFVKVLTVFPRGGEQLRDAPLVQILHILELFKSAHEKGESVGEKDIAGLADRIQLGLWNEYRSRLIETKFIRPVDGGSMVLSRDLREISLWDLYRLLPWPLPDGGAAKAQWGPHLKELLSTTAGQNSEALSVDVASLLEKN